jgi:alpha-glucosidase
MGNTPSNSIVCGKARFTFVSERSVRMEWSDDAAFVDAASLAAVGRTFPAVKFVHRCRGKRHELRTSCLSLRWNESEKGFSAKNLRIVFETGGMKGSWVWGQKDPLNCGATVRTLDGNKGDEYEVWEQDATGKWVPKPKGKLDLGKGFVSRSGWSFTDDSASVLLKERKGAWTPWVTQRNEGLRTDAYWFAFGQDYAQGLRDASLVFGRQPLPPRFAFGYWYSKYWAYTDRELEQLVDAFDAMQVPLDILVVDMDWHKEGWTGYTWDRSYFPDPADFLQRMRRRGLKLTLNLHPADGVGRQEEQFEAFCARLGKNPKRTEKIPFACTDPAYMKAYFELLHRPHENLGVDFWWMDWQQGTTAEMKGLDPLPWLNHLHWTDQDRPERRERPVCFSRYGGPGAGRYPVGFSGDTYSAWETLSFQVDFTSTAANALYGYWSHDIGGHMPPAGEALGAELYTRWVQFGIFSPVFRTHCTKEPSAERRFWMFPEPYGPAMIQAVRRRYHLIPYIYSECRTAMESGVSLVRPLYYGWPGRDEAYEAKGEYLFGSRMLVAPVTAPADPESEMSRKKIWLPEGKWFDTVFGEQLDCGREGLTIERDYLSDEIPVFVRPGTIIPEQGRVLRLEKGSYGHLTVTSFSGDNGEYELYEDDGWSKDYLKGRSGLIPLRYEEKKSERSARIGPLKGSFTGVSHSRDIEVRFCGTVPPTSVEVDGKRIPWSYEPVQGTWSYDARTATIVVRAGKVSLKKQVAVRAVIPVSLEWKGLKGLFARLDRIAALANLCSPTHPVSRYDRLAVRLAQTSNRIERDPGSFAEELEGLRRGVKVLKTGLEEFRRAFETKKNRDARKAAYLRKAGNIWKTYERE